MKNWFRLSIYCVLCISLASCLSKKKLQAQHEKEVALQKMINQQSFVFKAQFANPLGWRQINLNYDYDVSVSKDSVISYLPYFGRAYVAPINPTDPKETGIQFTSTKFDYHLDSTKHSGWQIIITPHDVKDIRQFIFDITQSGYATLSVNSLNRQQISFNGYITEKVIKKKNP